MKKFPFILYATLICALSFFISCGDKDSDLSIEDISKLKDYSYSDLSVEKQKEKLQDDANAFLSEMNGLQTNDGVKVLSTFNALLEINVPQPGFLRASVNEIILHISDFYGKYTWNSKTGSWDLEESSKEAEFSFPVGNQTGKIVASGISSGINYPIDYDYEADMLSSVELPKEIHGKIYLGNAEIGTIHAVSDIKNLTTFPSLSELSFVLGEYSLSANVAKASPNIAKSTLKKGNTVLIDADVDLSGNVDFLVNEEGDPGQMNGNAVINLQNSLAFAGIIDVTSYMQALAQIEVNYEKDYEQYGGGKAYENYIKADVKAYNDYFNLFLVSVKDRTKIASLKSKAVSETETWYGETYTYWEEVPVLIFKDNTEIEAEVFFSKGFETFVTNLNKFINAFQ
jgi:hypothetical protein